MEVTKGLCDMCSDEIATRVYDDAYQKDRGRLMRQNTAAHTRHGIRSPQHLSILAEWNALEEAHKGAENLLKAEAETDVLRLVVGYDGEWGTELTYDLCRRHLLACLAMLSPNDTSAADPTSKSPEGK